jgi:beta-1,4-N-acetylglucosaminyltransferase
MKVCFVTTGATAPFTALIESVLKPASLDALLDRGYTHLLVQFGSAKDVYMNCVKAAQTHLEQGGNAGQLEIAGIAFNEDGLKEHFVLVRETQGLVISHAGKLRASVW